MRSLTDLQRLRGTGPCRPVRVTMFLTVLLMTFTGNRVGAAPARQAGPPPAVSRPADPGPVLYALRAGEAVKTHAEDTRLAQAEARARDKGHLRLAASYAAARARLAHRFDPPTVRGGVRRPVAGPPTIARTDTPPSLTTTGANLSAYVPPGWADVLVPRNDTLPVTSSVTLPESLLSAAASFYVNFGETNSGDVATPSFTDSLLVDNSNLATFPYGAWPAGNVYLQRNLSLSKAIGGGRHTLTMVRDAKRQVAESDETDNRSDLQFVWSPVSLSANAPVSHGRPPARGTLALPNCDGFRATQNWWGAIALTPTNPGDDEDLALFTDYIDPLNGYVDEAAFSGVGAGLSEAVIVNGNVAGQLSTVYPAALWPGSAAANYEIEASANDTTFLAAGHYGPFTFGANSLVRIYEVLLAPGDWNLRLKNSGTANLDFAIMPPDMAYMKKTDALYYAAGAGAGLDESLFVHVPGTVAGYYGLLVLKHGSGDLSATATYDFYIDNTPPVVAQLAVDRTSWVTTNQFTFSWQASDAETGIRYAAYATNGAETQTQLSLATGPFAYTNGANIFSLRAVNSAGGSSAAQSVTFYYDGSAPTTSVSGLPATIASTDSITLRWSGADLGSGITSYDVDYKHAPSGVWSRWLTAITDTMRVFGATAPEPLTVGVIYAFRVRAHDLAGNIEAWPSNDSYGDVSTTVVLSDATPPVMSSLTTSPQTWSNANWFTVSWAALDAESGIAYYAYKTNGAETQTTGTLLTGAFAYHEGQNVFNVRAVNGVGATSASLVDTLYYDPTQPVSSMTALPVTWLDTNPLVLNWSGFDGSSGVGSYDVEYRILPSGAWTSWLTGTAAVSGTFAPGSWQLNAIYAFRARAHDRAGNTEAWPIDVNNGDAFTTVTHNTAAPPGERTEAPDGERGLPLVAGVRAMLAPPSPSPAQTAARIRLAIAADGPVCVEVWSAGGRLVRTLLSAQVSKGTTSVRWDLRDLRQHEVPSGLYLVRCVAGGRVMTQRIVVAH